ncbi:MAG: FliH/SctL family protein [Acidobacteriota bacterium]
MSSRARRVGATPVQAFRWDGAPAEAAPTSASGDLASASTAAAGATPAAAGPARDADDQARLAALERDAFAKGYAQGEKAGYEAGAKRADAMLRRLASTLEELSTLRASMIQQTERQMVQLALAVARRILRREAALDSDLVVAMARVALDRLGEQSSATVRLHPEDLAASGANPAEWAGAHVKVVGDASLARGQCQVESDFGFIDVGVEAQFEQVAHAMLGEAVAVPVPVAADETLMALKGAA